MKLNSLRVTPDDSTLEGPLGGEEMEGRGVTEEGKYISLFIYAGIIVVEASNNDIHIPKIPNFKVFRSL